MAGRLAGRLSTANPSLRPALILESRSDEAPTMGDYKMLEL